ncbi:hypothetical protein [Hymenobacter latericus]|uniref:hypothetical protein n=1 Tax=Hymenobacter sp. YIM 151858-1 TaxID=2987688 RepID=UPI002227E0D9|nr:hypothetical protein [Hymenobacter sp. YIM 151858-1]UYZ57843.1 hypothetical protein OIS50_12320 [Hymenobacter sp. YIM 151858-1]
MQKLWFVAESGRVGRSSGLLLLLLVGLFAYRKPGLQRLALQLLVVWQVLALLMAGCVLLDNFRNGGPLLGFSITGGLRLAALGLLLAAKRGLQPSTQPAQQL